MSASFNVITEPWIKAVREDGSSVLLGIRDTLLQAHELKSVSDASPLIEFGYYRLLATFLMDALRPESIYDLEELLECGCFSASQIDKYLEQCAAEGVSFDLFDPGHPFLQSPHKSEWDGEPKSVRYLDYASPTGNSHVHFDHLDVTAPYSFAEAARYLAPCYLFAVAGVQGYPSSVNSAPPYFTVVRGESLFESLVYLMVPTEEMQIPFDNPPSFWRNTSPIERKKPVAVTSWLYGALFPARRICLIPDEETPTVSRVYYSQGMNFCQPDNWTDTHVTYRVGKDGRFPWRPNVDRPVWYNLSDMIDISGKTAPKCIELYQRINGTKPVTVNVCIYGVQTNQASYLALARHDFHIPVSIMKSEDRVDVLRSCIRVADVTVGEIKKAFRSTNTPEISPVFCVTRFCAKCEALLWNFCSTVLSAESFDGNDSLRCWKQSIIVFARECMEQSLNSLNLKAKDWEQIYTSQRFWNIYLNKLRKECEEE